MSVCGIQTFDNAAKYLLSFESVDSDLVQNMMGKQREEMLGSLPKGANPLTCCKPFDDLNKDLRVLFTKKFTQYSGVAAQLLPPSTRTTNAWKQALAEMTRPATR